MVFFAKKILKRAENGQNQVCSKKYSNCTCNIIILASPEKFRPRGPLFQKIFSAKKKNKSKIDEFPNPGVTFFIGQKILCGPKLQI